MEWEGPLIVHLLTTSSGSDLVEFTYAPTVLDNGAARCRSAPSASVLSKQNAPSEYNTGAQLPLERST